MTLQQLTALAAPVVNATLKSLPPPLLPLASRVPVHYEGQPGRDLLEEGFEPDILGLFTGSPYGAAVVEDLPMPAEIVLFLENIWGYSEGDDAVFAEEVRITYLHELGHYLGWDEDDLAARDLD